MFDYVIKAQYIVYCSFLAIDNLIHNKEKNKLYEYQKRRR
ncbi:hypothetical protein PROSTU_03958 [Providencia stuartii ATCC 25827]|uniref:Uncharacterized protein n=1 Tax=Providencia stuartii ATCC 25827 TaxID=471874 RepID=A0AA86YV17_PROST|nr:hypothetical protein PROSTU_03958 [Providencia stuartii ATCC 25827]